MVRWPGVTRPGSESEAIVSTTDLYATLLEITGQSLRPEDHKDSESFLPALKGKAFDRGPLICDVAQFAEFVGNIPNTFVRDGRWKFYRYWFDSPGLEHRHELYDLESDIGETKNVAEAHPEICARLSGLLDRYFENEGILPYHPNTDYNGLRVSSHWAAITDQGRAVLNDSVVTLESSDSGFGIYTPMIPRLPEAVFHLEARSAKKSRLELQWTTSAKKERSEEWSQLVDPGNQWTKHSLPMEYEGTPGGIYLILPEAGSVELRNMRIATPEGTVMMEY